MVTLRVASTAKVSARPAAAAESACFFSARRNRRNIPIITMRRPAAGDPKHIHARYVASQSVIGANGRFTAGVRTPSRRRRRGKSVNVPRDRSTNRGGNGVARASRRTRFGRNDRMIVHVRSGPRGTRRRTPRQRFPSPPTPRATRMKRGACERTAAGAALQKKNTTYTYGGRASRERGDGHFPFGKKKTGFPLPSIPLPTERCCLVRFRVCTVHNRIDHTRGAYRVIDGDGFDPHLRRRRSEQT